MELVKFSEAYSLFDKKGDWTTSGSVTVDANGNKVININTQMQEVEGEGYISIGSACFQEDTEHRVQTQFSFENAYKEDFVDYCEEIYNEVLARLNK